MKFLMNITNGLLAVTSRLERVGNEVNEILKTWVGPLMTAIGGVASIYIIVLAIQYIKAESDGKRAEAKSRMMNCLIGLLVIIVLAVVCFSVDWAGFVKIFGYAQTEQSSGF